MSFSRKKNVLPPVVEDNKGNFLRIDSSMAMPTLWKKT